MTNQERSKDKTNGNTALIGYIYFLLTGLLIGYLLSRPRSVTVIAPPQPNTKPETLSREEVVSHLSQARQNNTQPVFRGANLHGADLSGLDLSHADLQGADLSGANLFRTNLSYADLRRVNATGTSFVESKLTGSFVYLMILDRASLPLYAFGEAKRRRKVIGDWEQAKTTGDIRHYHYARTVLLTLKGHLQTTGRYEDMVWAHQSEQRIVRVLLNPFRRIRWHRQMSLKLRLTALVGFTYKWFFSWGADLSSGYGQSIGRTVLSFFGLQTVFTIGYWATNSVQNCNGATVTDMLKIISFSFAAMTTTNLQALCPANSVVEFAMSTQVILGIAMTGLLGFVIGNRIQYST